MTIKTPEQVASEIVQEHGGNGAAAFANIVRAIEADRAQLVGNIATARLAVNVTYDAAEGGSNDREIEVLQEVRDWFEGIVQAVGGEWEHVALGECDYCDELATGEHEGDKHCDEHAPVVIPEENQCDQCDEEATNHWPNLKKPVQLCDACEHDARRSGWEPGQ
ncbi:hypothetical protein MRBLMI12_000464 [Microbacterium sp. LMI12-1-1.1]|uniref:hypothetical protein n=1 Tax=Microbacterium sp. LMI12-1-1.1 TaxID=3135225 RepID=UPI0034395629